MVAAPFAFGDAAATVASRAIPSSSTTSDVQSPRTSNTTAVTRGATATRTTSLSAVANTAANAASGGVSDSGALDSENNMDNNTTLARTSDTRSVVGRGTASTNTVNESNIVRAGSRIVNLDEVATESPRDSSSQRTVSTSRASTPTHTNTARENLEATVNTVGRNARVEAASINSNPAVRRAGVTLRPSTAEVGGRATIGDTGIYTGSNIASEVRAVHSRATTSVDTGATAETIAQAKERLEQTADLNASCQQQYNDCMDQFCSVVDSNQKRCSCSANLSNYARVEEAVTDANNQLNEVAQMIRYVGLSADEIRAIMTATEAEEALSGTRDTTETRSMLEEIEELIRDPSSGTSYSSSSGSTSFGLDMDLDFTSEISDLFSLDFLNTGTTSFSNLRGTSLYNAAKNRCKTILTQCEQAGANVNQITGNYDLAIDKDCIAYEQGLQKMNETLVSNVRSANLMLQKARLAVMQNKNQYDAKGCIAALETCMTDEMVCGATYTKCLDPTKKYIDENGNVILGQDITKIRESMSTYDNSSINAKFLQDAYGETTTKTDGSNVVKYLLQKIGTRQEVTDEGLCRAVLDKCQTYTYNDKDEYQPYNDVVVNYVQRAMVNIKAAQSQIISDYASNCMVDVATCYNQQVTQVNAWSSTASISSVLNVMRGACRNVALTCAYAVFDADDTSCPARNTDKCIESISQMFYQSLLCPDNSTYTSSKGTIGTNGYVNDYCKCNSGFEPWQGKCLVPCGANQERNSYGSCVQKTS